MHWFLLVLAGLLEVGWAIGLKSSHGFTRFWPSVATLVLMALSFFLLASALKHLPIGTAYAVWTGIGAVGTALLGISRPVVKAHGSSNAAAFCNAVRQTIAVAESGIIADITQNVDKMKVTPEKD